MDESITAENEKHARQKPPPSVGRIAGEILAGAGVGLAVALPLACVTAILFHEEDCFGIGKVVSALAIFISVFPMVYGPASAIGVYLVGNRDDETGSFLLTLGCGFAGGLAIRGMLNALHSDWLYWVPDVPGWAFVLPVLLILPLMTTCAFNLTRRYKRPVLPRSSSGKYFASYP
jgi:hypothetical protein